MSDLFAESAPSGSDELFTLVALNVQSPPQQRSRSLVHWLHATNADALILTELSSAGGSEGLLGDLQKLGYSLLHQRPALRDYGAAILLRGSPLLPFVVPTSLGSRVAACKLAPAMGGTVVVAGYVPSLGPQNTVRRPAFLSAFKQYIAELQKNNDRILVVGDLNIVEPEHVPRIVAFDAEHPFGYSYFTDLGLFDVFRSLNPRLVEHSWYTRDGEGQRLDHVLGSRGLLGFATECRYLHDVRIEKLSDHSALKVAFDFRSSAISTPS